MYDPKTVSEMLGIAPSSLRRYASEWANYLSETARRSGRKRRYTDSDIVILQKIRVMTVSRKTPEEIAAAIRVVDKDHPANQNTLSMIPAIAAEFESLRDQLAGMRADQTAEIQRLQDRLENLEKIVTESRRSFWDRLFGR